MAHSFSRTVTLASLVVASLASFALADDPPTSRMAVEEPLYETPPTIPGETVEHVFRFRNEGDAPLVVKNVATSRADLEAWAEPETVAPGESGTVRARLDTEMLRGKAEVGIAVFTNDPDQERTELTIRYEMRPVVQAHPGSARWIMVQGEEPGTITQIVGAPGEDHVRVTGVDVDHPGIEAEIRPADDSERRDDLGDGGQWSIDLTVGSDAPVGAITGFVRIRTDHPVQKTVAVPVSGFVRPQLHVEPAIADLGVVQTAHKTRWTLQLRNFGTKPVRVAAVDTDLPGTTVTVSPVEGKEGHRFLLELVMDPAGLEAGRFDGTVVVETDSPVAPRLEVPLFGRIAEGPPEQPTG